MSENNYSNLKKYNKSSSGFGGDEDEEDNLECCNIESDNKIQSFNVTNHDKNTNNDKKCINYFCLNLNQFIFIVNVLTTTIGVGVFEFPYILYEIGVFNSLFIFIFLSISVYYSLDLLRRFVVDSKLFSYSIITKTTLGDCWLRIYAISTIIFYMSNIVNTLRLMFKTANSMMGLSDNDSLLKMVFFLSTGLLEILLCLLTCKLSKLYIFSFCSFGISIILLFTVIIKGIIFLSTEDDKFRYFSFFDLKNSSTGWDNFLLIMSKIIEFFYGYISHSTYPSLLSQLDNISKEYTEKVLNISYGAIFIYYLLFSFFGLFCINDKNEGQKELFINEIDLKDNNILLIIFKSILIIYFLSCVPLRYIVIRDNYTSLVGKESLPIKIEIIITSVCFIIINLIIYYFVDDTTFISHLILIFGGIFGVFLCFVLPIISYIAINGKTKIRSIIGYIIAGIFILIGFFSLLYNFQNKDNI